MSQIRMSEINHYYRYYNDSFTHAQVKDLVYSKIEMSWAEIEALVLQKAEFFILIPFYCQFHQCQAYRVSLSKEDKYFCYGKDIDFDFCWCFGLYVLMR